MVLTIIYTTIIKRLMEYYRGYQENIGGKNSGKEVDTNVKLLFNPIPRLAKANANATKADRNI